MKILFVCTGNTCRSPMAEALLTHHSSGSIEAKSAGIFASNGSPASAQTIQILKDQGIDINHASQGLTPELLQWADLVLTMSGQHKQAILAQHPDKMSKVFTIKEQTIENEETFRHLQQKYDKIDQLRTELADLTNGTAGNEKQRQEKMKQIEQLMKEAYEVERQLPSLDVSDPFGGSLDVYGRTFAELNELIQKLTEKYS